MKSDRKVIDEEMCRREETERKIVKKCERCGFESDGGKVCLDADQGMNLCDPCSDLLEDSDTGLNWKNAQSCDLKRLEIIQKLLSTCPQLIKWLFKSDRPELVGSPKMMLKEMRYLSSGEQILIRVAIDVWSGDGGAKITDIACRLDSVTFKAAMTAIMEIRNL